MKWSELSPPWQACLEEAWAAYCAGSIPIGAVVVDAAGQIVSRGRNRIEDPDAPLRQTFGSQLAHAELNALLALGPRPPDVNDYAIYTLVEPCPLCLGAIYMSGVRKIYYASADAYAGSTNLLGKTWYLAYKPVQAFGPQEGALRLLACALHVEHNLGRGRAPGPVVERERQFFPQGVALGEKLYASGARDGWMSRCASIGDVFQEVTSMSI